MLKILENRLTLRYGLPVDTRVGTTLRRLRERQGASLREVAQRMGISHVGVSHRERGITAWSDSDIAKYLTAIGVTRDEYAKEFARPRGVSEPLGRIPR